MQTVICSIPSKSSWSCVSCELSHTSKNRLSNRLETKKRIHSTRSNWLTKSKYHHDSSTKGQPIWSENCRQHWSLFWQLMIQWCLGLLCRSGSSPFCKRQESVFWVEILTDTRLPHILQEIEQRIHWLFCAQSKAIFYYLKLDPFLGSRWTAHPIWKWWR